VCVDIRLELESFLLHHRGGFSPSSRPFPSKIRCHIHRNRYSEGDRSGNNDIRLRDWGSGAGRLPALTRFFLHFSRFSSREPRSFPTNVWPVVT